MVSQNITLNENPNWEWRWTSGEKREREKDGFCEDDQEDAFVSGEQSGQQEWECREETHHVAKREKKPVV